jgi:DNA-binding NtrC family response regulator
LQDAGFAADVAPSAERALELAAGVTYAGMVTDFRLPGINGIELIQELRRRGHPMPVVIVSAFMDFRLAEGAERAGALDVVEKPVDLEKLVALIGEFARRAGDVLIVDDNQELADNIAEALREHGIEPLTGSSAAAALEQRKLPRVALIDLRLPDRSGIDVAERLAARDPKIRILFMTGYAKELEDRLNAVRNVLPLLDREEPCLRKPFDLGAVVERLLKAVEPS